jgi:hypothetical protein
VLPLQADRPGAVHGVKNARHLPHMVADKRNYPEVGFIRGNGRFVLGAFPAGVSTLQKKFTIKSANLHSFFRQAIISLVLS